MMERTSTMTQQEKKESFLNMMNDNEGRDIEDLVQNLVENNAEDAANQTVEEGYSSIEIPAETDSEHHAAEPAVVEEVEAAEPAHDQSIPSDSAEEHVAEEESEEKK